MSGFLSKLRVVVLGEANDLLDKTIDLNSPSALRQYVRDLEDALDKMKNEAAVQAGTLRTLNREHGDMAVQIDKAKGQAAGFVAQGKTELARSFASKAVSLQTEYERNTQQIADQQKTSESLDLAVQKLDAKHTEMVEHVRELERLDRTTKAQEQSASALNAASKLVSGGATISIDDIEGKMRARGDVATEKFNRAMGDVDVHEDPDHAAAVDDLLASLTPKAAKTA